MRLPNELLRGKLYCIQGSGVCCTGRRVVYHEKLLTSRAKSNFLFQFSAFFPRDQQTYIFHQCQNNYSTLWLAMVDPFRAEVSPSFALGEQIIYTFYLGGRRY